MVVLVVGMRGFCDTAAAKNGSRGLAVIITFSSHQDGTSKEFFVSASEVLLKNVLFPCVRAVVVVRDTLGLELALFW